MRETGDGYPEITLLAPLAKSLGVTVDYLLSEDFAGEAERVNSPYESPDADGRRTFHMESGGAETAGSGTRRKEYKHGEIPVEWPKLNLCGFVKNPSVAAHMLHLAFFIIMTGVFSSSNQYCKYYQYWNGYTQSLRGYFSSTIMTYFILTLLAIAFLVLLRYNLKKISRTENRLLKGTINIVISTCFTASLMLSVKPVQGYITSGIMNNFAEGTLRNADYFQYNRFLILSAGCAAVVLYLLLQVVSLVLQKKKGEKNTSPDQPGTVNRRAFWKSLTIFNKISLVTILLCAIGFIAYLAMAFLITLSNVFNGALSKWGMVNIGFFQIVSAIGIYASKFGFLAALAGIIAGGLDLYDRQYKASIILGVINLVLSYLVPVIIMLSQVTSYGKFIFNSVI